MSSRGATSQRLCIVSFVEAVNGNGSVIYGARMIPFFCILLLVYDTQCPSGRKFYINIILAFWSNHDVPEKSKCTHSVDVIAQNTRMPRTMNIELA